MLSRRIHRHIVTAAVLVTLVLPNITTASFLYFNTTIETLIRGSSAVYVGRVVGKRAYEHKTAESIPASILTDYIVDIQHVILGEHETETIISTLGGKFGDYSEYSTRQLKLDIGDIGIFFESKRAYPGYEKKIFLYGGSSGYFDLQEDKELGFTTSTFLKEIVLAKENPAAYEAKRQKKQASTQSSLESSAAVIMDDVHSLDGFIQYAQKFHEILGVAAPPQKPKCSNCLRVKKPSNSDQ